MRKSIAILAAALALVVVIGLRPAHAEKLALMVGVNDYVSDRIPDLRGCENDVKLMQSVLVQKYGFDEKNIRVLLSRQATKDAILKEFALLTERAKPGDVVVFHFSGHGSQAPDDNEEEDDGIDETICPTDIRTSEAFKDIRDDELGAILDKLAERIKGGSLTVILDSCHSGTGTRFLDESVAPTKAPADAQGRPMTTRARFVYRPDMFKNQEFAPDGGNFSLGLAKPMGTRALPAAGTRAAQTVPYVLISGCKADQTSADAPFPLQPGKYFFFGALTYNLVGALQQVNPSDPALTYQKVVETAVANVKRRGFKQDPQIEGQVDARVFWAAPQVEPPKPPPTPAKPFVLVTNVGGAKVELGAGSAAGVTVGSVYTIYEPTDYKLDGPGIALVQVSETGATTCAADLRRATPGKLVKGCRAVETVHCYPPDKLYVYVYGPQKAAIEAALRQYSFVSIAPSVENYTDRILRVQQDGAKLTGWLVNAEGRRFLDHTGNNVDALVKELAADLTNAYIIKRLTLLDNPSSSFKVKVWVEGEPKKKEGENIVFKFKADRDCYLNLVDCGTSGKVTVLFPNAFHKDNRVQAGKEYSIPSEQMGFDIQTQGPAGRELVKAIATLQPLNLMDFDFSQLAADKPFLTQTLAQSQGTPARVEQAMSRSLGGDLVGNRSKDFKVIARPPAQTPTTVVAAPVAAVAPTPTPVVVVAAPPKPPVVVAAPPKPPAKPQPVPVTQDHIPTGGWATDTVIVEVMTKGV